MHLDSEDISSTGEEEHTIRISGSDESNVDTALLLISQKFGDTTVLDLSHCVGIDATFGKKRGLIRLSWLKYRIR